MEAGGSSPAKRARGEPRPPPEGGAAFMREFVNRVAAIAHVGDPSSSAALDAARGRLESLTYGARRAFRLRLRAMLPRGYWMQPYERVSMTVHESSSRGALRGTAYCSIHGGVVSNAERKDAMIAALTPITTALSLMPLVDLLDDGVPNPTPPPREEPEPPPPAPKRGETRRKRLRALYEKRFGHAGGAVPQAPVQNE